jgi:hypothetical protein
MRELAELVRAEIGSCSPMITRPLPQDDPKQRQPDITIAVRLDTIYTLVRGSETYNCLSARWIGRLLGGEFEPVRFRHPRLVGEVGSGYNGLVSHYFSAGSLGCAPVREKGQ